MRERRPREGSDDRDSWGERGKREGEGYEDKRGMEEDLEVGWMMSIRKSKRLYLLRH